MASLLALLSSTMWGFSYFVGGRVSARVSAYAVTAVSSAVTAAFFLIFGLLQGRLAFDRIDVAAGLVAGITTLLAQVCVFTALTKGPMGVVGGIQVLLVVIPMVWSIREGDPVTATELIGVVVMLVGVILLGAPEMKGSTTRLAVVLAFLAALLFGVQQVAIAEGSRDDAYVTLFLAQLFTVVALSLLGLVRRSTGGLTRSAVLPLAFVGLANAVAFAAFAEATLLGDPGLVSALASLDPVVLALLAFVVLRQRLLSIQVAALGLAVIGGILIAVT